MTAPFDLDRYDACVFDLDGTVWLGARHPIPGAAGFLDRCRDRGIAIVYATNSTVHAPDALSQRLVEAGLARPGEPVVTSGVVMARTLRQRGIVHVAGVLPHALARTLTDTGIEVEAPDDISPDDFGTVAPDRALVLAASRDATIGSIERLGRLAAAGHPVYISSKDAGFPIPGGIEPGGGVLLAALRAMYDVPVTVLGKPSPEYAAVVRDVIGGAGRTAMFGDSQRADIGTAHHLGADAILLTGHSVRPIDPALPDPTYVGTTLADTFRPYEGTP